MILKNVVLLICIPFFADTNKPDSAAARPKYHKLKVASNGSLNITPTSRNTLLNNQVHYGYKKDALEFNINTKWIYGNNREKLTNNDFTGSLDGNFYYDKGKRLNSWVLGSFISSYSLNIFNEYQMGFGVAYSFFDGQKNKHIYLNVSDGFLWEKSNFLNKEGERDEYFTIRNSLRVQLKLIALQKKLLFESNTYWQPALNMPKDYNLRTVNVLNIPLWKFLSIQTKLEYNYITRTQKENTLLTYGIGTQFLF